MNWGGERCSVPTWHGNRIAAPSRLGTGTTDIGDGFHGNSVGGVGDGGARPPPRSDSFRGPPPRSDTSRGLRTPIACRIAGSGSTGRHFNALRNQNDGLRAILPPPPCRNHRGCSSVNRWPHAVIVAAAASPAATSCSGVRLGPAEVEGACLVGYQRGSTAGCALLA